MGVFQTPCAIGLWKGVVPRRIPQNTGQGGGFVAVGRRFSLGWAGKLDLGPPKQRSHGQAPPYPNKGPIGATFLELTPVIPRVQLPRCPRLPEPSEFGLKARDY